MNKGSDDLPIEYINSSLAQQNQVRIFKLFYYKNIYTYIFKINHNRL